MLELPNPRLETHFYSELLNRVSTALNEKVEWKEQVYLSLEGIFSILTSLEILLKEPKENLESAENELLKALERKLGEYNAFFKNLNIELERETNALKETIKQEQESIKALELALKQSETKSLKILEEKKENYLKALKEQQNTLKADLIERTNVLKQELETLLNALKQDLLENKENALLELNERLNAILSALNTEKQSALNALKENAKAELSNANIELNHLKVSAVTEINALKENATTELNNNKQSALNAIENKETSALESINALKELSLNSLNALKENIKNALNLLKENATTELNALKESFLSESKSLLESKQLEINASLESVRNSVNESLENREFLNTKLFYFEREINFINNTNTFKKIRTLASLENQQTLLSPNKHYLIECFFKYEFKNTNEGEIVLVFGNDENFDIPAKGLQTLKGLYVGGNNTYGVYLVKFFYTPRMEIKEIALYAKGIVSLWVNVNYLPTDGFWQKFKDFNIHYHNNTLNKRIEDSCTFSAQTLYLQITELSHYMPSISMT
ncbi:hypothetical protein [Helicobacter cetorum]|uniref:Uncharacterized protein n=1 Tax=Helicobacter cetorum (strain ATCC BAA-429 / MIT 00-7128) TaxID=182217 RepID=I0ELM5_HELC0|nr:hypothetical protein [Helicobacter cetorum]AFI03844.1 hypothetical protein HCW_02815 [Helicobacter cetorum MIT 00-7128]